MRHLVYAVKVMINEDLKAQDRRKVRRVPRRSKAVSAAPSEPLVQSAPASVVRKPEVARSRKTANVST